MMTMSVSASMMGILMVASGPHIPDLDMKHTCHDIAGSAGLQNCLSEERYAFHKLKKYWHKIPNDFKMQCIADPTAPDRNYVFLRDCINNNFMVRKGSRTY